MKILTTVCSLAVIAFLAPQHKNLTEKKDTLESKSLELTQQIEAARSELATTRLNLVAANTRIAQLTVPADTATKSSNWVADRNRNWQSSLGRGAYDNRHAVTFMPQTVVVIGQPDISNNTSSLAPRPALGPQPRGPIPPPRMMPPTGPAPVANRVPPSGLPPAPLPRPRTVPPLPPPSSPSSPSSPVAAKGS